MAVSTPPRPFGVNGVKLSQERGSWNIAHSPVAMNTPMIPTLATVTMLPARPVSETPLKLIATNSSAITTASGLSSWSVVRPNGSQPSSFKTSPR